jgi:anti-sigma regulatory factor (Ser/Thr protein kinase)
MSESVPDNIDVEPAPHGQSSAIVAQTAACGFYLALRPEGFTLYMSASPEHVSRMRQHVHTEALRAGGDEETADSARVVASELVGNAVRLCGPHAPVVVQVDRAPGEVCVRVHDPVPAVIPERREVPPDNAELESGRGLWILDALAPGWTVEPSPFGKLVGCRLPIPERRSA